MFVKSTSITYKLISVLICIMLVLTFTLTNIQETQAVLPLVAIPELVLVAGAALLTAAGIQFATSDDARSAAYKVMSNVSLSVRNQINTAMLAGTAIPILPELWSIITGQAKTFNDGTGLGTVNYVVPGTTTNYVGQALQSYTASLSAYQLDLTATNIHDGGMIRFPGMLGYLTNAVTYNSTTKLYSAQLYYHVYIGDPLYPLNLAVGSAYTASTDALALIPSVVVSLYTNPGGAYLMVNGNIIRDWGSTAVSSTGNLQLSTLESAYFAFNTVATHNLTSSSFVVNNYYYNNPANDWENRQATVPGTMDGVIAKDASNVLTDAGALVNAPGTTTTTDNILSQILSGVNTLGATISGSISSAFTGDGTGSIDWTPLEISATLFTTKFPFSLPWDLLRAVQSLGTSTTIAPVIPISLNLAFFKWNANLDFSLFNPMMPTVRSLLLFGFGIGLVYSVRRLVGGDA